MTEHKVTFDVAKQPVRVPTGTLLSEAAHLAGVDIGQPCGGQGRCGRCAVQVTEGDVRRRSSLRLTSADVAHGFALACQSVIEGDIYVIVPPQEKIERRLTTDRTAIEVSVPSDYDPFYAQTVRRISLRLPPPRMDDQTDDWSRLKTALRQKAGIEDIRISLNLLQKLGNILRENDWQITVITDAHIELDGQRTDERLLTIIPDIVPLDDPIYGIAIDIGTTTVTVWLVDLISGKVEAQASEYNGQISRGEDVISRIIYSSKNGGREELQNSVLDAIVDKVQVTIYTDPVKIEEWLAKARAAYDYRNKRLADLTDDKVEEFYSCTLCQSFAPNHVCVVSPERLGLCGAYNWLDCKASFSINPTGPNQPIKLGKLIDSKKGYWTGTNEYAVVGSHGVVNEVTMYSIMENPMTACGCFECICMLIPEANGIMVVSREDPSMTPAIISFKTLLIQTIRLNPPSAEMNFGLVR